MPGAKKDTCPVSYYTKGNPIMNEGLWVLVGVLLGFVGAYLLQRLAENRRKKQLRTVARNIIGMEIIHNLNIIGQIEDSTIKTINEDKDLLHTATFPPRNEVFDRLLDLPSLSVLDDTEQTLFTEIFSQLNVVTREFSQWPDEIRQVAPYGSEAKESVSQSLLRAITILRMNLVQLLCEVCLREGKGLQDRQLQAVYQEIHRFERGDSGRAGKSSDFKKAKRKESFKRLVVWEHDWIECPLEVIELKSATKES